jgi:hypothetical protein
MDPMSCGPAPDTRIRHCRWRRRAATVGGARPGGLRARWTVSSGPAVSLLCGVGDVLSRHACGRPWIIGQHRSNALELLAFGPRRVAILGECLDDINRQLWCMSTGSGCGRGCLAILRAGSGRSAMESGTPLETTGRSGGKDFIPLGTRTYAYSRRAPVGWILLSQSRLVILTGYNSGEWSGTVSTLRSMSPPRRASTEKGRVLAIGRRR